MVVTGSVSYVDGSVGSEEPGYPTLPGSTLFGPSGPKEWAFPAKAGLFWPKAGFFYYPGSRVFPCIPVFPVFPVFPEIQSN